MRRCSQWCRATYLTPSAVPPVGWADSGRSVAFVLPPIMGFFVHHWDRRVTRVAFWFSHPAICLALALTLEANTHRALAEPVTGGKVEVA